MHFQLEYYVKNKIRQIKHCLSCNLGFQVVILHYLLHPKKVLVFCFFQCEFPKHHPIPNATIMRSPVKHAKQKSNPSTTPFRCLQRMYSIGAPKSPEVFGWTQGIPYGHINFTYTYLSQVTRGSNLDFGEFKGLLLALPLVCLVQLSFIRNEHFNWLFSLRKLRCIETSSPALCLPAISTV